MMWICTSSETSKANKVTGSHSDHNRQWKAVCKKTVSCAIYECQVLFKWSPTFHQGRSQNGEKADGSQTKPLLLAYNGTALSGPDATGMAFRKALCLERSHLISTTLHPSIRWKKTMQYLKAFSYSCALSLWVKQISYCAQHLQSNQ